MGVARGPGDVEQAARAAESALADAFSSSAVTGSREEWAAAVGSLQRVIDVASAAQDAAIARLAAIEPEELDDGTTVETHRACGHVALDAPAIVSGVLAVSAVHAERRVRTAVRLAADGPEGTDTETGLGVLHAAMAAGRLDAYRAGVVAEELEEAPPQVRAGVVASLDAHLDSEDAAHLRRRCRRVLARISPDLLRQRAQRARAESGLRRWVDEPGVDRWEGRFPSEEAAQAWAAIDALARRYVADAVCSTIERARAKALTDLVAGNASVETVLTVTVPAAALPDAGASAVSGAAVPEVVPADDVDRDALVEVTGTAGGRPVLVSRGWVTALARVQGALDASPCHPGSGALVGFAGERHLLHRMNAEDDRYRPSPHLAGLVRARDRRCRFPGCTVAAVFCDLDHVRPWPSGSTTADNLMCLCRRHHRVKQRAGWHVTLAADALATWTDPTGRVRTTVPADALHVVVLTSTGTGGKDALTVARPRAVVPDGAHSHLELRLEHAGAGRQVHRGRRPVDLLPPQAVLLLDAPAQPPRRRRSRTTRRCPGTDPPPF